MGSIHNIKNSAEGVKATAKSVATSLLDQNKSSMAAYDYTANATTYLSDFTSASRTGFKNFFINGELNIWQRNISKLISTAGLTTAYSADRFKVQVAGTGTSTTVTRESFTIGQIDVPGEPTYFLRSTCTNGGDSTNGYHTIFQAIENVILLQGKQVTLSFWAKADSNKTLHVEVEQMFGTTGSPSAIVDTGVGRINITSTWAKYTLTFTVPSITGKTLGTDGSSTSYTKIQLWMSGGSAYTTRFGSFNALGIQSGTFDLALLQIEEGSRASSFDYRPIRFEKALCNRYCYSLLSAGEGSAAGRLANGLIISTTSSVFFTPFTLRKPNTIVCSDATHFAIAISASVLNAATSIDISGTVSAWSVSTNRVQFTTFTGATAGTGCFLQCYTNITTDDYLYMEADF